jgi:DNA invertase Pin-like site-specific DNA recombinase
MKLIPYLRQSKKKEQSISIGDQRTAIRRWAKEAGVALAEEVIEEGVSGSKSWRERALGQAVATCEAGKAAGIIVAYQDRLSRENGLATAEVWEALELAGVRLVAAAEGLDTAAGDHEMLFTIKAAIAREQWKRHRLNWNNARQNAVGRGVKPGPCPAGYSRGEEGTLVPNGDANAVREAFRLRADEGANWHKIARFLTERGVVGSKGNVVWTPSAARRLGENRNYLGEIKSGEFVNAEAHPALVDEVTFRRANRKEGKKPVGRGDGPLLGGGLVRCGTCGSALVRGVSKGREYLRCSGTTTVKGPHACIGIWVLEPYLIEQALERHTGWLANLALVAPDTAELDRAVEEARVEVEAVEGMIGTSLPVDSVQRRALEAALDELAAAAAPAGAPRWATIDPREMLFEVQESGILGDEVRLVARDIPTARQFLREMLGQVTLAAGSRVPVEERIIQKAEAA